MFSIVLDTLIGKHQLHGVEDIADVDLNRVSWKKGEKKAPGDELKKKFGCSGA